MARYAFTPVARLKPSLLASLPSLPKRLCANNFSVLHLSVASISMLSSWMEPFGAYIRPLASINVSSPPDESSGTKGQRELLSFSAPVFKHPPVSTIFLNISHTCSSATPSKSCSRCQPSPHQVLPLSPETITNKTDADTLDILSQTRTANALKLPQRKMMHIGWKSNFDSNHDLCNLLWSPSGVSLLCKGNSKIWQRKRCKPVSERFLIPMPPVC